ncbi:MAG TPA: HEPN domain-containing protein [Gemmataceae bacterium]|nr:HEPN domain-containing protein [Gemmataceae bacterium]
MGKEPRRFFRAAGQRLQEAQFLLQNDYATASVYLAGYAVECILKVLILASEPEPHHLKTITSFRGVHGHDFGWLRGQLHQRRITIPVTIIEALTDVRGWTTDLRYDPTVHRRRDAEVFLAAAEQIIQWVHERL